MLPLLLWPGLARADSVLAAMHDERWAEADALAAAAPDPLARKLVLFYRLLTPGAARSTEIAAFMAENPEWPQQALLSRRLADALVRDRDDRAVLAICQRRPPDAAPSLLRCADAAARTAQPPDADARRAWLLGVTDPSAEAAFMRQWGRTLTADDQRRRFDRLAWTESAAPGGTLARQAVRLDPASRPAAETRLALRRDDAAGPALFTALPEPARADPGLVLDLVRWYRRAGLDRAAAQLWTERGAAAERAAPLERQPAFWDERNLLARRLLRAHEDALAYAVAGLPTAARDARLDAEFLAGWIALRRLARPAAAAEHFRTLAALSGAAITQGRAAYWLGLALAAGGDHEAARDALTGATAWPTTFYGQLAALSLGDGEAGLARRIRAAADPSWDAGRALDFAGGDLARAAALLCAWGEPRRAKAFLARLDERARDPVDRALAARFAAALGLPEQAVAAARRAGRDGLALPEIGWPEAVEPPAPVEAAITLGLIRQESSFDAQAASPAGATGLMQLMPATAAAVARRLNEPRPASLTDAAFNMRLGTVYLQSLLDRFGALPPAIAAYNAGPNRVVEWLAAQGDPATGGIDPIDWIELIPFNETRNYVQRVIENIVIYRARKGSDATHPVVAWTGTAE
ncbi:MAG: transglycosylase SLT domain-containing protein [Acetobacteraceae bacterium]